MVKNHWLFPKQKQGEKSSTGREMSAFSSFAKNATVPIQKLSCISIPFLQYSRCPIKWKFA